MTTEDHGFAELLEGKESVFNALTPEQRANLSKKIVRKKYRKGQIIFHEGDEPLGLVCLIEGKAKLYKKGVGGKDQIVRLVRPNGLLGYRALFSGENNLATAEAIEPVTICVISKNDLYELIEANGKFAFYFINELAHELGVFYSRTISLTQKHIRGRLAETLLFLIDTYGFDDDGMTIKATLLREDMASLSNMTTSNAIRTLSAFASENIIQLSGKKIKILQLNILKKISSQG